MSDELRPCPCCGGVAKVHGYNETPWQPNGFWLKRVYCQNCGIRTRVISHRIEAIAGEQAREAWNRRHREEAIVADLRRARDAVQADLSCGNSFLAQRANILAEAYDTLAKKIERGETITKPEGEQS